MSEKELMYIDDTMSHLKSTSDFLNELDIENESYKEVIDVFIKVLNQEFNKYMKYLNK